MSLLSGKMESRMCLDGAGGGVGGLGKMEVALAALGTQQRAGKGSAAGERMANKEDICFLSWMWQPVVGCTEGQRGAVTAPPPGRGD